MRSIEARIKKLEQIYKNAPPLFLVRFDDGTAQRMDIVHYALLRIDCEIGKSKKQIVNRRLIRGDLAPFHRLREFLGEDW